MLNASPVLRQTTLTQMAREPTEPVLPSPWIRTVDKDRITELFYNCETNRVVDSIEKVMEYHNQNLGKRKRGNAVDVTLNGDNPNTNVDTPTPGVPNAAGLNGNLGDEGYVGPQELRTYANLLTDMSKDTNPEGDSFNPDTVQSFSNRDGRVSFPDVQEDGSIGQNENQFYTQPIYGMGVHDSFNGSYGNKDNCIEILDEDDEKESSDKIGEI